MMKRIEVTVSPTGETRIETLGFEGESCRKATKSLEQSLGAISSETFKPEFYQETKRNIEQKEVE